MPARARALPARASDGAVPLPTPASEPPGSARRKSAMAASARSISAAVSTIASRSSPLRRVKTICVVMTR